MNLSLNDRLKFSQSIPIIQDMLCAISNMCFLQLMTFYWHQFNYLASVYNLFDWYFKSVPNLYIGVLVSNVFHNRLLAVTLQSMQIRDHVAPLICIHVHLLLLLYALSLWGYYLAQYILKPFLFSHKIRAWHFSIFNPGPAEPEYALPLQTVLIQISRLLKKLTDLDLHCLSLSMWICIYNLDQVIWLAEN